jgi:rhodanese-related sulfurtransferase
MKIQHIPSLFFPLLFLFLCIVASDALSKETVKAGLTADKPFIYVKHEGHSIKVVRNQDPNAILTGYYAKTARACPPFCLQPMVVAPGVTTIGETELFTFMETKLKDQQGILIDARMPEWFRRGTIPGSINIPFSTLKNPDSAEMKSALTRFGAKARGDVGSITLTFDRLMGDDEYKTEKWDFTDAKDLVLWCNSPQCGQSPRAIKYLLNAGYPASKIFYYRGGMQLWKLWGLTTVVPEK